MTLRIRRVVAVGFVAMVVALTASPATGTHPGEPGRLAFPLPDPTSWEAPSDIYVADVDGSNRARLTTSGATFPAWSPNGAEIAYLAVEADWSVEPEELWVMDAMGGSRRLVEDRFWIDGSLEWSPDGSEILFFGALAGRSPWGLWAVSTVNRSSRLVMDTSRSGDDITHVGSYSWAPSGEWIAASVGAYADLVLIDPDTGSRDSFYCPVDGSIDWSPFGDVIVASGGGAGDIWLCDVEGSSLRQIVDGSDPDWHLLSNTMWSPDGESILFTGQHRTHGFSAFRYWMESEEIEHLFGDAVDGLDWQPRQGTFWDDEGSVFISDIEWMAAEGITKGCNPPTSDRFCPESSVTRGQMAAFLVRALDLPAAPSAGFVDTVGTTFEKDIDKLAAAGITRGCNPPDNDRYCPDDKVRREVMAAFLVRALGYTDDGGGDLFNDDDGSIFETDIDKLATAGITKGCNPPTNDRFCPTQNVTRGQMAAFLHRAHS